MQSAYHNCPTIDGVMQAAGRQYEASEVSHRTDDGGAEFRLNLARAYPGEAHVGRWDRTLRLDRAKNEISLADDYALTAAGEGDLAHADDAVPRDGRRAGPADAAPRGRRSRYRLLTTGR